MLCVSQAELQAAREGSTPASGAGSCCTPMASTPEVIAQMSCASRHPGGLAQRPTPTPRHLRCLRYSGCADAAVPMGTAASEMCTMALCAAQHNQIK